MAKITCEVVRDLLPLYVDDVLSADGRAVVDEHLAHCRDCTEYHNVLRSGDVVAPNKTLADKTALKKIRGKLFSQRVVTALVAALCVAAVALGTFWAVVVREIYIPYEESGLAVRGDALQTDRSFYMSHGVYTPDGESCFIYLTTTVYANRQGARTTTIEDLSDEGRSMTIDDGTSASAKTLINSRIYYVSEEYARRFESGALSPLTDNQIAELKAASVLVWEAR